MDFKAADSAGMAGLIAAICSGSNIRTSPRSSPGFPLSLPLAPGGVGHCIDYQRGADGNSGIRAFQVD